MKRSRAGWPIIEAGENPSEEEIADFVFDSFFRKPKGEPWLDHGVTEREYHHILYCANSIHCMAEEGWCPAAGESPSDYDEDITLAWLVENQNDPSFPEMAGEWLTRQFHDGKIDAAERLGRYLVTQKIRADKKIPTVLEHIASFMEKHLRWPERREIVIEGISERTRDAAFEQIQTKFKTKIDGREKWVDPQ